MNLNGNILLGVLLSKVISSVELLPRGARGREGTARESELASPGSGKLTALFAAPRAS